MSIHDGHRDRLRQRFLEHGLDNFSDVNVLELMLCYVIPRRDVNPIAHALLDTFGSLHGVFEATPDALMQVDGVGENVASMIRLIPQINRRYLMSREDGRDILPDSRSAGEFVQPRFLYEREEVVLMVCLDSSRRVLCCKEIARGETNTVSISIRKLVELAISQNSAGVILAHNHTSGIAIPSQEDINTTIQIRDALKMVGIQLTDHLVMAGNDFVSMSDSELI